MSTALATINNEPDQEQRINKLREEIGKLGGTAMSLEATPADVEEEFLRHVLEYEAAEPITILRLLENAGYVMPSPDTLDDQQIDVKLGEAISKASTFGVYLIHTNHLTGRQLYEYLFNDGLHEEAVLFPDNPSYAYMIDLTGNGSEEDNQTYLRYYASEENRQRWAQDWPDDSIPDHEDPPFQRDEHLPQPPLG